MIQAKRVCQSYRRKSFLQSVTCSIPTPSVTAILGRNGAGKSTFLRLIAGMERPTSGELTVNGHIPFNNLTVAQNTILIDESFAPLEGMTSRRFIEQIKNMYPLWDDKAANALFQHFHLPLDRPYKKLSKGMQASIRFITGICTRAPITILDEATDGMDINIRKEMYELLLQEMIHHERTFLIASHHMEEVEHLLSYALILDEGRVLFEGDADELRTKFLSVSGPSRVIDERFTKEDIIAEDRRTPLAHIIVDAATSFNQDGLTVRAVSLSEAYMYATGHSKGGISYVYNDTE